MKTITTYVLLYSILVTYISCNQNEKYHNNQVKTGNSTKNNLCDSIIQHNHDQSLLENYILKNNFEKQLTNCGFAGCYYEKKSYFKCDLALIKSQYHCKLTKTDSVYLDSLNFFLKEIDMGRIKKNLDFNPK